jgi:hypothetical protein
MDFNAAVARMSAGIAVWALHFMAVYGVTALACARGWPREPAAAVGWLSLAAVAALVAVLLHNWRRRAAFEAWFGAATAAFALVGVVWEALGAGVVTACA